MDIATKPFHGYTPKGEAPLPISGLSRRETIAIRINLL